MNPIHAIRNALFALLVAGMTLFGFGGCSMDGVGVLLLSRLLNGGDSGTIASGLTSAFDSLVSQLVSSST